jgi:hypothetical protein
LGLSTARSAGGRLRYLSSMGEDRGVNAAPISIVFGGLNFPGSFHSCQSTHALETLSKTLSERPLSRVAATAVTNLAGSAGAAHRRAA